DLLGTGGINTREVSERRAFRLEFCEGIDEVVVIKIVVDRRLLVGIEGVIHLDLELIATIVFLGNGHYFGGVAAGPRDVLQKAHGDGIETSRRNLVAHKDIAVGNGRAATGNTSD